MSGRAIFATSSLVHARKRDKAGHIVGVTMCGANTRRTDEDRKVTCSRCLKMLARLDGAARDLAVLEQYRDSKAGAK